MVFSIASSPRKNGRRSRRRDEHRTSPKRERRVTSTFVCVIVDTRQSRFGLVRVASPMVLSQRVEHVQRSQDEGDHEHGVGIDEPLAF